MAYKPWEVKDALWKESCGAQASQLWKHFET